MTVLMMNKKYSIGFAVKRNEHILKIQTANPFLTGHGANAMADRSFAIAQDDKVWLGLHHLAALS